MSTELKQNSIFQIQSHNSIVYFALEPRLEPKSEPTPEPTPQPTSQPTPDIQSIQFLISMNRFMPQKYLLLLEFAYFPLFLL